MYCRFRGPFAKEERERIERAVVVRAVSAGQPRGKKKAWLIVRATPKSGQGMYAAIRFSDGWTVRATTVEDLVAAIATSG